MRGRLSGAQAAPSVQLPAGQSGHQRPVRGHSGDADGHVLGDQRQMDLRRDRVQHMGELRRAQLHRLHPQSVHDQRGPLLRHHQAARVRGETDSQTHDTVGDTRVVLRRLHQPAAAADPRQRTLGRRDQGRSVFSVAAHRLSAVRDHVQLLHTADGHDFGLLQDIPGCPSDSERGEESAEPSRDALLSGDQREERRRPAGEQDLQPDALARKSGEGQSQVQFGQHEHYGKSIKPFTLVAESAVLLTLSDTRPVAN